MPVDRQLRALDIDIPAKPEVLVRLSLLLADEDVNLEAVGALVESDMALAASMMKAVNSSLYGLKGRVQSVHQAVSYLGTREVAGITFEMGLRAAFPPSPELEPIWDRAGRRGVLMGRLGQALGLDAWAAHSAGLFEECGKAVLFRHAPEHYPAMLRAAHTDRELAQIEHTGFGVSHEALGAALCDSWGLGATVVASVRGHVEAQATRMLQGTLSSREMTALSVMAYALIHEADQLEEVALVIAPQAGLDTGRLLKVSLDLAQRLEEAESVEP